MRGFEVVSIYQKKGVKLPKRQTEHSAGYDLELIEDIVLEPHEVKAGKTGLKAYMESDEVLYIYPRSSLAVGKKRKLKNGNVEECFVTLPNNVGVIDADYYNNLNNEGHIQILLYNFGKSTVHLEKGERVAQAIFSKYLTCENEQVILKKRTGGFGSTDKKQN